VPAPIFALPFNPRLMQDEPGGIKVTSPKRLRKWAIDWGHARSFYYGQAVTTPCTVVFCWKEKNPWIAVAYADIVERELAPPGERNPHDGSRFLYHAENRKPIRPKRALPIPAKRGHRVLKLTRRQFEELSD
jgi:hypothetical protein